MVKLLAYGWSSAAVDAGAARPGRRRAAAAAKRTGWDGLVAGQRAYLDDVVGACRRGGRRRSGSCSRRCGSRSSRWCRRGARAEQRAIPAKGLTGRGYDGHTFWDMETYTLPVLTYTAPDCRPRRAALAALDPALAQRTRARSCGWAVRRFRGGRSAARSARVTGRPAPRPSTSTPTSPTRCAATSARPATASSSSGPGLELLVETARLVAIARPPRRRGLLPHRRRDRSRRVHRARRQQRVHEPHGGPQPPSRRRCRPAAIRSERRSSASTSAEITAWRDAADAMVVPFDDELGVTSQSEGFTRYRHVGLRGDPAERVSAAAPLPVLPAVLQPGRQAGRPRLRALPVRRPFRRRAEATRLRLLRGHHRPRLVAVGVASRRSSRPRSGTSTSPTTTSARPPSSICATWPATRLTVCISPRWPGAWLVAVAGFGGLRDHGDHARVRPAAAAIARAVGVPAVVPGPPVAGRDHPRLRSLRTHGWRSARSASPWTSDHTGTSFAADHSVSTSGKSASSSTATRSASMGTGSANTR